MKTGLVLEGGAMRGMYTAGVLDVFMEHGIRFDGIMGVSAGAVFGVNYPSGQVGRVIRYNCRFNTDKDYMGIGCFLKTGDFFSKEYAFYRVPRELDKFDDETFMKSDMLFYAVVTNIENGEPEYIHVKSVLEEMEILRASCSMPFASKPVEINGKKYLDGGVTDSIPFEKLAEMGYEKQVVVLTRDKAYRKKPMNRALTTFFYRQYPEFRRRLKERHVMYNESLDKLEKRETDGKAFVIRPSEPINISRTERAPERLKQVYELGRADTEKQLSALLKFLK